ncbi:MAB_1171c family putative transporter [Saccharopolyspora sp. NPDC049357]|uniref:MAB_1171c family putative transporter n=1 Tax=Saccharopolyspora sp. NPDC049357 TaxID=3154507 RepID=UPI00341938FD
MSGLVELRTVLLLGVIVFFGARLVRTPQNRALWALMIVLVLHFSSDQLQDLAYAAAANEVEAGGLAKLIQNIVLAAKLGGIAAFFLLSTGGPDARRRARWEVLPFLAGTIGMTAAMFSTPAPLRDHSFTSADMQVPGIASFYLIAGAYFIYITAVGAGWAWAYARESDHRLGLGLRVAAFGLACMFIASVLRAGFAVVRAFGGSVPPGLNRIGMTLLIIAQPAVITGLILGAVLTVIARASVWWRQRRQWRQLRPLWAHLHAVFPDDALDHQHQLTDSQERWAVSQIRRRWWRRVVEIRDGLVQLSPYLHAAGWDDALPPDNQAAILRTATEWRQQGATVERADTVPVAAPPRDDLAADLEQLLTLSRALAEQPRTAETA